jgi:CheY-like chemotaxis protein
VRALDFPNARVRLSAALAAIEAHPEQSFSQADRLVSILAQSLDTSSRPRAVVVDADLPRATAIGQILTQMGYDPLVATTGRDGTKAATETSLVELTVIDSAIHSGDLRSTLDVLSADARCAGVPTLVVTREPPSAELEQILQRYRHTILVPAFNGVEAWKRALSLALTDKASLPMNDEERSRYRQNALGALVRIARGEFHYLNPDPAIPSLAKLLRDESLAPQAAEALGYLPSAPVQEYLLTAALDSSLSVSTRMAAARALARNVTRGGSALAQGQRDQLIQALSAEEEPDLRAQLAAAVGAIDPQGESATPRITKYRPSAKPREPVTPPASSTEASAPSEDPASDAVPTDAPAEPAAEESP